MLEPKAGETRNPLLKGLYFILGVVSLAAGVVGAFLPVVPTTPFLLLSAWCFLKSSNKAYQWLVSNEKLGPTLKNYHEGKGLTTSTKIRAVSAMWAAILFSTYFFVKQRWLAFLMFSVALGVTIYLYRLPTLGKKRL